jgi:peptidoglycan-associated lipoprotein
MRRFFFQEGKVTMKIQPLPSLVFVALVCLLGTGSALAQSHPPHSVPSSTEQQQLQQSLHDVHFAFDRYDLSPEDRQAVENDANWLKANPNVYVTIRGEADERGSVIYNLVLSQKRATATRDALVAAGVPAERIVFATGWGKLYPVCMQADESCWGQNRRAQFSRW